MRGLATCAWRALCILSVMKFRAPVTSVVSQIKTSSDPKINIFHKSYFKTTFHNLNFYFTKNVTMALLDFFFIIFDFIKK